MALFDSLVSEVNERFDLGDKGGALVSALLGLIVNNSGGGLNYFLDLFRQAALGEMADSWVSIGANAALSNQQTEDALSTDALNRIANQTGIPLLTATSAISYLIPTVIDKLTPNGVVPDENSLQGTLGNYLTDGVGGATGTIRTAPLQMPDRTDAAHSVTTITISDDNSVLRWILPLLLLGLLGFIGYQFCSKPNQDAAVPVPNTNIHSNVNTMPTTSNSNAATHSNTDAH